MSDLKNNPHFMEGHFVGRRVAKKIEGTVYKTLEVAIKKKQELIDDLKENFGWDDQYKDVAYNHGLVKAFKEELEKQSEEEE